MRARVLGAAAGGGLPQWNCGCSNCQAARRGRIRPQTQFSAALRDTGGAWFLVNASPDLPAQLLACPDLHPPAGKSRGSPIAAILLTNADLDHVAGLLALREGARLRVYSTSVVRETLTESLGIAAVLENSCGVDWVEAPMQHFRPLQCSSGKKSSVECRAIPLPGGAPPYAKGSTTKGVHNVAFQFWDRVTSGKLLAAPDVAGLTPELEKAMEESDVVLFDGTFWSEDELRRVKPGARTAAEMGHLPIEGSLGRLARLAGRRRVYIHVNNTNPAWTIGSPQRAVVEAAGVEIGSDGLEFEV